MNTPALMNWDPTGTYLYVADNGSASGGQAVTSFTLGPNGALTQLTTTPIASAVAPLNPAVTPNGSDLYVVDGGGGVWGFTLTSGSPSTTPIAGSPFPTAGTSPTGIAIDPTSTLVAVDNSDASSISVYTIGTGGVLSAPTNVTVPGTPNPSAPYYVVFYNTF